ncbi:hypothetical protein EK21DRAFT_118822 [Setomelanomma holmii]|uniref:Uncharacterized protein n=1 Tax=Setomelanomma holmii TaxID=210430 RepID=A0A9P4GXL8_9PLEO|nr:hypothetical protein EK21DRAFT_118822 [Setomelanomma holmii]
MYPPQRPQPTAGFVRFQGPQVPRPQSHSAISSNLIFGGFSFGVAPIPSCYHHFHQGPRNGYYTPQPVAPVQRIPPAQPLLVQSTIPTLPAPKTKTRQVICWRCHQNGWNSTCDDGAKRRTETDECHNCTLSGRGCFTIKCQKYDEDTCHKQNCPFVHKDQVEQYPNSSGFLPKNKKRKAGIDRTRSPVDMEICGEEWKPSSKKEEADDGGKNGKEKSRRKRKSDFPEFKDKPSKTKRKCDSPQVEESLSKNKLPDMEDDGSEDAIMKEPRPSQEEDDDGCGAAIMEELGRQEVVDDDLEDVIMVEPSQEEHGDGSGSAFRKGLYGEGDKNGLEPALDLVLFGEDPEEFEESGEE